MADKKNNSDKWVFRGFAFPTTTQVPDQVFDELLPRLKGAELKVLLYICRRTFGFKKRNDRISLDQIANGIRKKDGGELDAGTGLSRRHVQRVLKSLEEKHIINVERKKTEDEVNEINVYSLNFIERVETLSPYRRDKKSPGVETSESLGVGTQESTTTNSKQQTDVVVKGLVERGITSKVAQEISEKYSIPYIRKKLELFDYLLEIESPLITRNPAGYLYKAITDDYVAPKSFKSRAERDIEKKELARQQTQTELERKALQEEENKIRSQVIQKYGITEELSKIWQQLLDHFRYQDPNSPLYARLEGSFLLSIQDGIASIGIRRKDDQEWLEVRGARYIANLLTGFYGEKIDVRFELLDFDKNGPK